MTSYALIHYSGACFCSALAFLSLLRDWRSLVHHIFAIGMLALAAESFLNGLTCQAVLAEGASTFQQWRMLATAFVPGTWLLFSLSFTQSGYRTILARWKWIFISVLLSHLALVTLFRSTLFSGKINLSANGWVLELGRAGYWFYIILVLSIVLIIIILEETLRASKGLTRWKVKFLVLGLGGFFAVRIFTVSQNLLFQSLNLEFELVNSGALIAACFLISVAVYRAGTLQMNIYFSQKMLSNSLTILIVGLFFLALGLSTKVLTQYLPFTLRALLIFVALLVLVIALLSDRLRLRMKHFVSTHFQRPQYDYRDVWMTLTNRMAGLMDGKALCNAVARTISEMFDTLSVSIWLLDEEREVLRCGGSTVFSEAQARSLPLLQEGGTELARVLCHHRSFVDLEEKATLETGQLQSVGADFFGKARIRWVIPLRAAGSLLGFISLGDRVKDRPFSIEETDILKTVANHLTAGLLNLKLSERLRQAKEMEAFQTVSTFFVHDLKNLASKLSLMFKNIQVHFDNPEFRQDAIRLMAESVNHMNTVCSRLSSLREKLDMRPVETDLNELTRETLASLAGLLNGFLDQNLHPVPKVYVDPEQIRKVLTNLILNAIEALGDNRKILVATGSKNGWLELTVSDNGSGMSEEFMAKSLFRPFKTTKKQGTGIGLFQSKMIIEAHKGMIKVESQEGKGSTFRVLLPLNTV